MDNTPWNFFNEAAVSHMHYRRDVTAPAMTRTLTRTLALDNECDVGSYCPTQSLLICLGVLPSDRSKLKVRNSSEANPMVTMRNPSGHANVGVWRLEPIGPAVSIRASLRTWAWHWRVLIHGIVLAGPSGERGRIEGPRAHQGVTQGYPLLDPFSRSYLPVVRVCFFFSQVEVV